MPGIQTSRKTHAATSDRTDVLAAGGTGVFRVGAVELDVDGYRLLAPRLTELPIREFRLLKLLMENAGRALSRRYLLDHALRPGYPDTGKTLDVHIYRLRSKISCAGTASPIRTVRGYGYVFDRAPLARGPEARRDP